MCLFQIILSIDENIAILMREAERLKRIREKRMENFGLGVDADDLIGEVSVDDVIEGSKENDVTTEQDPEITSSTFPIEISIDDYSADCSIFRKRKSETEKKFIPFKKFNAHSGEIVCIDD